MHRQILRITYVLILISLLLTPAFALEKQLIRIPVNSHADLKALALPRSMEFVTGNTGYRDFIATADEIALLKKRGVHFDVLDSDVEGTLLRNRAGYPTLAEVESHLQTAASTYPGITDLFSIGKTYQNRDIWCLEISDNPGIDEGEAELVFIGLHHAREWPSVVLTLHIIDQLTANYGSDPTITGWVDTRRIWVVPCFNPDGYHYCRDQGYDWRKNRHYLPQHGTTGVDLNRNYPGSTNGDARGDWGSTGDGAVTHWPDYETYCGPGAGSELETQAMMDFLLAHDPTVALSYHTYSELVLWPWGYDGIAKAPDNALLQSMGQAMAGLIAGQSGGYYTPKQSAGLYP
ncbi:MAG: M14 family metallopeptidase, partial [Planctomycetota bacterium]